MAEKIVRINRMERYGSFVKKYGVLIRSMNETAVVNFDSNMDGIAINIAHEDYSVVSPSMYKVEGGRVFVYEYGEKSHGYVDTGLMLWER